MKYKGLNVPSGATHYRPEVQHLPSSFFKKENDRWSVEVFGGRWVHCSLNLTMATPEELPPPCHNCQGTGTTHKYGLPGVLGACLSICQVCDGHGTIIFPAITIHSAKAVIEDTPPEQCMPKVGEECGYSLGEGNAWSEGTLRFIDKVAVIEGRSGIQRIYDAKIVKFRSTKTKREKFILLSQINYEARPLRSVHREDIVLAAGWMYDNGARY